MSSRSRSKFGNHNATQSKIVTIEDKVAEAEINLITQDEKIKLLQESQQVLIDELIKVKNIIFQLTGLTVD